MNVRGIVESLQTLWRESTTGKRALFVGAPVAVLVLAGAGIGFAMTGGGGEASNQQVVAPTAVPTDTPAPPSPTSTVAPVPTDTPASAGLQSSDAPPPSTSHTGGNTGGGAARRTAPDPGLSGPGAPTGTGMSLVIPSIGVNAAVYGRTVGTSGQMGNPSGPWDVVWYDFSQNWSGLGGYPGEPGANAVFAGHVDYIHVGPAVFWSIRDLAPGDRVTVNTPNGPVNYAIDYNQWADPEADFSGFVGHTGAESITLVSCIGSFSGGHYSNRVIVRGHRV